MVTNFPDKIVIHHSYNPEDNIMFNEFDAITRYYTTQHVPKYSDNPYHYGIEYVNKVPFVSKGRSEDRRGAHAVKVNGTSIGIVIIGNYDLREPNDELLHLCAELIVEIYSRRGVLPIYGHRHFSNKTCPGGLFPMWKLQSYVDELMKTKHWAEKHYNSLIDKGWQINEKRYDDAITRGEMFALLDKNTEVM